MVFKKIVMCFLVMAMVLGFVPHTVLAQEQEINNSVSIDITNVSNPDNVVYQGNYAHISFDFKINKNTIGGGFELDEKIEVTTNIGELFDADWNKLSSIQIKGDSDNLLAVVSITSDKILFVIKDGAVGSNELLGRVISTVNLVAKDVGAKKDKPVTKKLIVGNVEKEITFKVKDSGSVIPSERGPVDIAASWKNASSNDTLTGAGNYIEINPIGSMDLYGYYTYPKGNDGKGRTIKSYDNFVVKDVIQEQGYIDKNSVKIYAAVPYIAVRDTYALFNGWYDVPAGTLYAGRKETIRYRIDKNTPEDAGKERVKYLTQNANETYDEFYQRIVGSPLQWGIYYDSTTNTETFLCNFGGIGHSDPDKNNEIKYSDYKIDKDRGGFLGDKNFLADTGPTAGNIVSYYIEFNSYYPEVKGKKDVDNAVECYNVTQNGSVKISGNKATFEINNGGGFGAIRKNELGLMLVDKEDSSIKIDGARFKIQQLINNSWVDTNIEGVTDNNGYFRIKNFPVGTYKIVQLSTIEGYAFDNKTYGESGNAMLQTVSQEGVFSISDDKSFGVGTIVTNIKKKSCSVEYKFESKSGEVLPSEVNSLLPQDSNKYYDGDTINAIKLSQTLVNVADGVWVFNGYDKDSVVAKCDTDNTTVTFVGTWEFKKSASILNHLPTISASDKTLTVGDKFDPLFDVSAKDIEDGDITKDIKVIKNSVDTSKVGVYEVTYSVTDSKGATTTKSISVNVIDKVVDKPVTTPTPEPTVKPTPEATATPEAKPQIEVPKAPVYDDGGPFTTDECGSVYDRWGNLMWKAPSCKAQVNDGYSIVNTSDR